MSDSEEGSIIAKVVDNRRAQPNYEFKWVSPTHVYSLCWLEESQLKEKQRRWDIARGHSLEVDFAVERLATATMRNKIAWKKLYLPISRPKHNHAPKLSTSESSNLKTKWFRHQILG